MLNHLETEAFQKHQQPPILGQLTQLANDSSSLLAYTNNHKRYQPILSRPVRDSVAMKLEKFQSRKAKSVPSNGHDESEEEMNEE